MNYIAIYLLPEKAESYKGQLELAVIPLNEDGFNSLSKKLSQQRRPFIRSEDNLGEFQEYDLGRASKGIYHPQRRRFEIQTFDDEEFLRITHELNLPTRRIKSNP